MAAEVDSRTHDAVHGFDHDEERFAEFLAGQGQTRERVRRPRPGRRPRSRCAPGCVLDALADAEQVSVERPGAHRADRLPGPAVPDAAGGVRPADPAGRPARRDLLRRAAQQGADRRGARGDGDRRVRATVDLSDLLGEDAGRPRTAMPGDADEAHAERGAAEADEPPPSHGGRRGGAGRTGADPRRPELTDRANRGDAQSEHRARTRTGRAARPRRVGRERHAS